MSKHSNTILKILSQKGKWKPCKAAQSLGCSLQFKLLSQSCHTMGESFLDKDLTFCRMFVWWPERWVILLSVSTLLTSDNACSFTTSFRILGRLTASFNSVTVFTCIHGAVHASKCCESDVSRLVRQINQVLSCVRPQIGPQIGIDVKRRMQHQNVKDVLCDML